MSGKLIGQRLVLVFLLALVMLNDPVMSLFDKGKTLLGLPLIYVYLMVVWAGLIGLIGWTVGRSTDDAD
jgi:hypothetical protein